MVEKRGYGDAQNASVNDIEKKDDGAGLRGYIQFNTYSRPGGSVCNLETF